MVPWTVAIAAIAGLALGWRFRASALITATAILVIVTAGLARWIGMSGRGGLAFVLLAVIALQVAYLAGLLVQTLRRK